MTWKIAFVIGLAFIILGGWLARRQHLWLKGAQVVRGTVAGLSESRSRKGTVTYRPRLRYMDRAGVSHEFVDGIGSSSPGFKVGDNVLVAYDTSNPSDERLVTVGSRYGLATFIVAFGVGLALWSAAMVAGQVFMARLYAPDMAELGP